MRKTKVIVTLSPKILDKEKILEMIDLGVDGFRLNFAYEDYSFHLCCIKTIRNFGRMLNKPLTIIQDIGGCKVRVRGVEGILNLKSGDMVKISRFKSSDRYTMNLSNPEIINRLGVADTIYFNDGKLQAIVKEKFNDYVIIRILNGGDLYENEGMNLPYCDIGNRGFNKKDLEDLNFGARYGVDVVALSFVREAVDVLETKKFLKGLGAKSLVFSKIELGIAIKNLDSILEVSDGVVIARGDLGVEVGVSKVPYLQKKIIQKANLLGIPSITSNQILSSLIDSLHPTRAEISDIANAVYDGTDAIILSQETAIGNYPIEAISLLNEVVLESEINYIYNNNQHKTFIDEDVFACSATRIASSIKADGIVIFTTEGIIAKNISRYRPRQIIYAICYSPRVRRQLNLLWGVNPIFLLEEQDNSYKLLKNFIKKAVEIELLNEYRVFVLAMGCSTNKNDNINLVRILDNKIVKKMQDNEQIN